MVLVVDRVPQMMLMGLMGSGSSMVAVLGLPQPLGALLQGPLGWGSFVGSPPPGKQSASDWASQWPQAVRQGQAEWVLKTVQVLDRVPWMVLLGQRGSGSSLVGR